MEAGHPRRKACLWGRSTPVQCGIRLRAKDFPGQTQSWKGSSWTCLLFQPGSRGKVLCSRGALAPPVPADWWLHPERPYVNLNSSMEWTIVHSYSVQYNGQSSNCQVSIYRVRHLEIMRVTLSAAKGLAR